LLAGYGRGAAGDGVLALASGRRLASQARGGRARGGAVALVVPSRPGPDARGRAPGPPGDPPARRPVLRAPGVAVGARGRGGGRRSRPVRRRRCDPRWSDGGSDEYVAAGRGGRRGGGRRSRRLRDGPSPGGGGSGRTPARGGRRTGVPARGPSERGAGIA